MLGERIVSGGMYMKGVTEHNHHRFTPNRMTLAREDKEAFFKDDDDDDEIKREAKEQQPRCDSAQSMLKEEDENSRPITPDPLTGMEKRKRLEQR